MVRRMSELLAERATESFVGRKEEIAVLLRMLEEGGGPLVMHVHGAAGIGKSSLVEAYAAKARAQRATVVSLDCRAIEPTPRGFTHELGAAIGFDTDGVDEIADRLSEIGGRVVLTLDTYEVLLLLDTWLRQVFIPALGDNVRVVLAGREPPIPAWNIAPEWQGLFESLTLGPLSDDEAVDLLVRTGVPTPDSNRINKVARGHPLALKLAASTVAQRPELDLEQVAIPTVVRELTRLFLADVYDPLTRRGIEASSVVRRSTQSLLGAMLANAAPRDVYERLSALPIMESGRDGLNMHDAVRKAVAASLKASDPARYQDYRRAAWRQLRSEVRTAAIADLWRYTADMLYMIEHPVVREAFFPSGDQRLAVEPARSEDGDWLWRSPDGTTALTLRARWSSGGSERRTRFTSSVTRTIPLLASTVCSIPAWPPDFHSKTIQSSKPGWPILTKTRRQMVSRLCSCGVGLAKKAARCRRWYKPPAGSISSGSTWSCGPTSDVCI